MIFRRIIFNALGVGAVVGLLLSIMQIWLVNPIIFAAEAFEINEPDQHVSHNHGSHHHSEQAWVPADGQERTLYTVLANILAGIGFASIILACMSQLQALGFARLSLLKGAGWGVAGFIVFFAAPGIGLPPDIPGIEAAPVNYRQLWWLLAVGCVGVGLLLLAYAPLKLKWLGLMTIALPYLVDIPHGLGPVFKHSAPVVVQSLTQLHQQFIVASATSNFLFWLLLGVMSAWVLNRRVLQGVENHVSTRT